MTRPSYTDLERMIRDKDAKIARMEAGRHKQDIREDRKTARIIELEEQLADRDRAIAALERANDRLVEEKLELRGTVT